MMTKNKKIILTLAIATIFIITTAIIMNYTQKTADNLMQGTNNMQTTAVSGGLSE